MSEDEKENRVTPKKLLFEIMQELDKFEDLVIIGTRAKDTSIAVRHSSMTNERIVFMSEILKKVAFEE